MIELRPYQQASVDAIFDYWSKGGGNPLVDLATGLGKSVIIAKLTQDVLKQYRDMRVLILVHVRELVEQDFKAMIRLWPSAPVGINSAGLGRRDRHSQILFASIQSVYREDATSIGQRDLVLIDECFVAGTLITTPSGGRPIEVIKPGDIVNNASGVGTVDAISRSRSAKIVRLELSDGSIIRCTERHPFFTERGWTDASKLGKGAHLYRPEDVRKLRRDLPSVDEGRKASNAREGVGEGALLHSFVREAERERHVDSWSEGTHDGHSGQNWAQAKREMGQRLRPHQDATSCLELAGARLDAGVCGSDIDPSEARRLSDLLQDRRSSTGFEGGGRTGRQLTLRKEVGGRSQERCTSGVLRVEDISIEEPQRHVDVFNLQVSGHPSYYAGGVLVHNCHLVPKAGEGMYRRLLENLRDQTPDLRVAGFTATPFRLDSGRLDDDGGDGSAGRLFDEVVYSYGIGAGIADGWLSPLISKASATEIDVSGVAKRGGEFVAGSLEAAADKSSVTAAACAEITRFGADRRSWLIFCSGVQHAHHVRDELKRLGIAAETVTGETPAGERTRLIRDFREGRLRCLTNAQVLTTGFDSPETDLIVFLRPTLSTGLYLQMVGRGVRKADGKPNCLVLDFAGNVRRHGPVDAINAPGGRRGKKGEPEEKTTIDSVRAKGCPGCESLVAVATHACPYCGYEWPTVPKHEAVADDLPIMSNERPSTPELIPVVSWEAQRWTKIGSPDSVRVTYYAGLQSYSEWVFPEHSGMAKEKARLWWLRHGGADVPATVTDALAGFKRLSMPSHIAVKRDPTGKWFNIVSRQFAARKEVAA